MAVLQSLKKKENRWIIFIIMDLIIIIIMAQKKNNCRKTLFKVLEIVMRKNNNLWLSGSICCYDSFHISVTPNTA